MAATMTVVTNGTQSEFNSNEMSSGGLVVKTEVGCMTTSSTSPNIMMMNCVTTTVNGNNGTTSSDNDSENDTIIHHNISSSDGGGIRSCTAGTSPSPPTSGGYEVQVSSFINGSMSSPDHHEQLFFDSGTSPMVN